ncbi:hypothetical protein SARC_08776 [Sphaeroforma arctica JP610]|uniref:CCHC-type domain-containing protein n=1 Tax=Sphaeroforma arctica JP610 TaxID=667725 RepID=A0A0L0FPS8_9EUKA|nr:hypothetical protein SARC_08776 [Sphaeroforma arctica JP610]KNC78807.1 hypothetical protein SARC_08776 [Sphaeroforma arctica JP610]|eukprot:XP_014152709.1 hypothetical protein SARC_08776 [Sphaeroforma arctica JP610]
MNNIRPPCINKLTPPPTNPLDIKLKALIKRLNAMTTTSQTPTPRQFQCYICWSTQHHSGRCPKACGKCGDTQHTARDCKTSPLLSTINCNRQNYLAIVSSQRSNKSSFSYIATPYHTPEPSIRHITRINPPTSKSTNDKLFIDGGATGNYFNTTARHRLMKLETGIFPLQLADESTTTITERGILPNIGMTYISPPLIQQLVSQNLLQDNGYTFAYPSNRKICRISKGTHHMTIPREKC